MASVISVLRGWRLPAEGGRGPVLNERTGAGSRRAGRCSPVASWRLRRPTLLAKAGLRRSLVHYDSRWTRCVLRRLHRS